MYATTSVARARRSAMMLLVWKHEDGQTTGDAFLAYYVHEENEAVSAGRRKLVGRSVAFFRFFLACSFSRRSNVD